MATPLAQAAWDALPDYIRDADTAEGLSLLGYLAGPLDTLDPAAAVIRAGASLGDPALVPRDWLDWLATLGGVDLTGESEAGKRSWLAAAAGFARGSVAAITARVGATLTGSRSVTVEWPYLGSVARVRVTTLTGETPDTAARDAAARVETPAWLRLDTASTAGMTYSTMSGRYTPYSTLTATGKTYATLTAEV